MPVEAWVTLTNYEGDLSAMSNKKVVESNVEQESYNTIKVILLIMFIRTFPLNNDSSSCQHTEVSRVLVAWVIKTSLGNEPITEVLSANHGRLFANHRRS